MDIQSTLNILIQAVVMSFVALMVFDFADGLWGVPLPPAGWQPPVIEQPIAIAPAPQPTPVPASQFEEIRDPWLEPAPVNTVSPQPVIVPLPALRLLPPAKAQEVQPTKPKRKRAKSSAPRKQNSSPKRQRQPKSRKITA